MRRLAKTIVSVFYVGHARFAPGTFGSLAGLIIYYLVKDSVILYGFAIAFLFALGIMFAGEAEKIYGKKDARSIVIDETCGMLLALFLVPYDVKAVVLGFIIFRLLDILKPPPARKVEEMAGSLGVMMDDAVSALYTNIILQILVRYLHIFGTIS